MKRVILLTVLIMVHMTIIASAEPIVEAVGKDTSNLCSGDHL